MRITILSCVLLFCAHTTFAASRLPQSAGGSEESKPPKTLYSKGKGTIGLVSVLLLGPVGWLGVRLLSRNKVQRTQAKKGPGIWTIAIVSIACIFLIVLVAKAGGKPDFTNTNFNFGGGGGSAPVSKEKKKPAIEATPQPSWPGAIKPL